MSTQSKPETREGGMIPSYLLVRGVVFNTLLSVNSREDPGLFVRIPMQPAMHAFGTKPTVRKVVVSLRTMLNTKAVGPDKLPEELLKLAVQYFQLFGSSTRSSRGYGARG